MARVVREPIQVYLTATEREALDEEARRRGVSRSEVLRQGIDALRDRGYRGELRPLVERGVVTPPRSDAKGPPPSKPVAALDVLLGELDEDRGER
jgi:hypothetical protein